MSFRPALVPAVALAALGLLAACDPEPGTGSASSASSSSAATSSDPVTAEVQRRAAAMCNADPSRAGDCAPVVACFGESGPALVGRSYLSQGGRLSAEGTGGLSCTGGVLPTVSRSVARVHLTCSDGSVVDFQFRTASPGNLRGQGVTQNGVPLTIWSGRNMWRDFDAPGNAAGRACVKAGLGL
ncbi:hypothetical protein [Poseidonocella sp. HB161398]|uniref:hypothetical protein n=1 Tax=Poseidonocella sp. HB161398 TaxID=2320855 RepID=UPI001108A94C|nr:hypothetical protein [Poseidonocella sp. HB161398]